MKRVFFCLFILISFASAEPPNVLSILAQQVAKTSDPASQKNILRGMNAALQGRSGVAAPPEWTALAKQLSASSDAEVRELALSIGIVFGTKEALDALRAIAANPDAEIAARQRAIESLVARKDAATLPLLGQFVEKPTPLRRSAIRGLAAYDAPETAGLLLGHYAKLGPAEKTDALSTLAARPAWAKQLVAALEDGRVARADYSAALVRQLRSYKDAGIDAALDKHFGKLSGTTDKQPEIAEIKKWLTPAFIKSGNAKHGREVFNRTCAICHKLFDAGTEIGPELTGANRADIDYLLQNVIDPNALIGADYQLQTFELKDGRILAGMVRAENASTITLRTLAEQTIIAKGDVKTRTISPMSMMPEGQVQALPREDVRDLFLYLASPQQVPLP
ncbi:MAG: HEAT repeat domain-containing protein [Chthoniobacteraceae bacterium]